MTNNANNECQFHFDATTVDNVIKISKTKVKTAKILSYNVCNNCDIAGENGYYWNGIYPIIITELAKTEIDLLQTRPIATISFGHENRTDGYWMISYSSAYKLSDLEKLKNDFLVETNKLLKENKWEIVQNKYESLKSGLREKKIIIFKIGYAD